MDRRAISRKPVGAALRLLWLVAVVNCLYSTVGQAAAMQVSVSADRTRAFVNQQILLTVVVSAPVEAFSITGDKLEVANVRLQPVDRLEQQQLTDDSETLETVTVYSLFASRPGTVRIPALAFSGRMPVPVLENGARAPGGNPRIDASSDELAIEVQPAPASDNVWFPASDVQIRSKWLQKSDVFTVGEPFQREVSITAVGQYAAAIPPIELAANEPLRVYPAQPRLTETEDVGGLTGTLHQSMTLLAARAGSIEIPALSVNWWDTRQQRWQVATLPAETIAVQPAATGAASDRSGTLVKVIAALALLVACLLVTTGILWRNLRRLKRGSAGAREVGSESQRWRDLQRCVRRGQAIEIRRAIVAWIATRYDSAFRLEQLAQLEPSLAPHVQQLDAALYNADDATQLSPVQRKGLLRALKLARKRQRKNRAADNLPVLYPEY